jgi:hypothetical protein
MASNATRRANQYRHRAAEIEQRQLPRVRDEADRKHLLELVAMYRRAAEQMAPATSLALQVVKITSGS